MRPHKVKTASQLLSVTHETMLSIAVCLQGDICHSALWLLINKYFV